MTKADVLQFWLGENVDPVNLRHPLPQGFDLGLRPYEGNCDLCFNKGKAIIKRMIRDNPGVETWWVDKEHATGGTFHMRYSIADLAGQVREAPGLFDEPTSDLEFDAECGFTCANPTEGE